MLLLDKEETDAMILKHLDAKTHWGLFPCGHRGMETVAEIEKRFYSEKETCDGFIALMYPYNSNGNRAILPILLADKKFMTPDQLWDVMKDEAVGLTRELLDTQDIIFLDPNEKLPLMTDMLYELETEGRKKKKRKNADAKSRLVPFKNGDN